jgi:hypothetical protein
MRERCECGKANCVYCNPIDIPARSELLEQIEQLQTELAKAQPVLDAAINQAQYFSENGDSTVFQIFCGKTNTAVREYKEG